MTISATLVAVSLILGLCSVLTNGTPGHKQESSVGVEMSPVDFLIEKWKLWYKHLDVNHDGIISKDDMEYSRITFCQLYNLEADKEKTVMKKFKNWWNTYVFEGQTGEISEQQFVDNLKMEFIADKAKFCTKMQKRYEEIFKIIDTNKDKSISKDEFVIALKAYGHTNVRLDTRFFKSFNPIDGLVPLTDIVIPYVNFATSTDSSKKCIFKDALEAGL